MFGSEMLHFPLPMPEAGFEPIDFRMMSQVFYYCVTGVIPKCRWKLSLHKKIGGLLLIEKGHCWNLRLRNVAFFHPSVTGRIQTQECMIVSQVFYHCAIGIKPKQGWKLIYQNIVLCQPFLMKNFRILKFGFDFSPPLAVVAFELLDFYSGVLKLLPLVWNQIEGENLLNDIFY